MPLDWLKLKINIPSVPKELEQLKNLIPCWGEYKIGQDFNSLAITFKTKHLSYNSAIPFLRTYTREMKL